jgi:hypothetical protein
MNTRKRDRIVWDGEDDGNGISRTRLKAMAEGWVESCVDRLFDGEAVPQAGPRSLEGTWTGKGYLVQGWAAGGFWVVKGAEVAAAHSAALRGDGVRATGSTLHEENHVFAILA